MNQVMNTMNQIRPDGEESIAQLDVEKVHIILSTMFVPIVEAIEKAKNL